MGQVITKENRGLFCLRPLWTPVHPAYTAARSKRQTTSITGNRPWVLDQSIL